MWNFVHAIFKEWSWHVKNVCTLKLGGLKCFMNLKENKRKKTNRKGEKKIQPLFLNVRRQNETF